MKIFAIAVVLLSTIHMSYQENMVQYIQDAANDIVDVGSNSWAARTLTILYDVVDYCLAYQDCKKSKSYCEYDAAVAAFEGAYVVLASLAGGSSAFGRMNEIGYDLYAKVDRQEHRETALWAREHAKYVLKYRLDDNSNEFHPFEPKDWKSTDPNFNYPVVRLGKNKPFFFESYRDMQKRFGIYGPPSESSEYFKAALQEIYEKSEVSNVEADQKLLDAFNLWSGNENGMRIVNVMADSVFDNKDLSMKELARALYMINMAMHDAYHFAFFVKHKYERNRPRYYINNGISIEKDENWRPFNEGDSSPDWVDSFGSFYSGLRVLQHVLNSDKYPLSFYSERLGQQFNFADFDEARESITYTSIGAGSNIRPSLGGLQEEYEKMGSKVYYKIRY